MQRISLLLIPLATFCLGCGSVGNSISSGSGSTRVGNTTAEYYMANGGMMLVVWLKHPPSGTHGGGSGVSSGPTKMVVTGSQRYGEAPSIEWRCETTDGKTGTVTLGGGNYELAKGGIFLVDMSGDKPTVTQLTRETASIKSKAELEALAKTDLEIKKFVSEKKADK
jgi:hypothetical protein